MDARELVRLTGLTGLAVATLLGTTLPVTAGTPETRYVDDDGRAGPVDGCDGKRPAFRRIQRAINASGPGDTVLVCDGLYREQLTISGRGHRGLILRAVDPERVTLETVAGDARGASLTMDIDADLVRVVGMGLAA